MKDHAGAELYRVFPVRLLTVTAHDLAKGVYRRVWSSRPDIYPVPGTKPMTDEAWIAASSGGATVLVIDSQKDFDAMFPDAGVLRAIGCGAALTVPVLTRDGTVAGTVNMLDADGWFVPGRIEGIVAGVRARSDALLRLLGSG
mgnify:FL=1